MKFTQLGQQTHAYIEQGQGETFVLLHGFPLNHSMWESQINELSKTHRVLALNLRGHGKTSVTRGTVTMRDMADDTAKILDAKEIHEPLSLCGLSMGGYVAWEFWRQHRSRLRRLILCDTRAAADTEEVARGRQMMAAQVVHSGSEMAANSMVPKLFGRDTYDSQPAIVEAVRQMILETDPQGIAATQRGMAQRIDMTSHLSEVAVPTLVVCGAEDAISPTTEMKEIADALPNASYVEIPNAGHLAPLEQPTIVNKAIRDFLATT